MDYGYYDSDYFENGSTKGTAYNNFLANSKKSLLYREIAEAVARIFRPRRVLEVGCATGIVVKHLNDLGIETHGIDVSEWCIANKEHPNVILSGVESLPFPDGHFDLVVSAHALEHIPVSLKDRAFAEMGRVCPSGVQFHTLPIIGLGPYQGEHEEVRQRLRKDPTHSLMNDKAWWLAEFATIGFKDGHVPVFFEHEAGALDLGTSQLLLSDRALDDATLDALQRWNTGVVGRLLARAHKSDEGQHMAVRRCAAHDLTLDGGWGDLQLTPSDLVFSDDLQIWIDVFSDASVDLPLRLCFVTEGDRKVEATFWRVYKPGQTSVRLKMDETLQVGGSIVGRQVAAIYFGGTGQGAVAMGLTLYRPNGSVVAMA